MDMIVPCVSITNDHTTDMDDEWEDIPEVKWDAALHAAEQNAATQA